MIVLKVITFCDVILFIKLELFLSQRNFTMCEAKSSITLDHFVDWQIDDQQNRN